MAQTAEEKVKALKTELKKAEDQLKAERAEKARKEREERIAALTQKTLEFQKLNSFEAIGEPRHWIDVTPQYGGGLEVVEYEWQSAQSSFSLTEEETLKLRDFLNNNFPG